MRARARVYPPYHACFLFAFLLSFVSAVFARGSARPILMTVCIPHTHPHRHLSHMFFFSSSAAAARIMPTLLSYRAAAPRRICHTLYPLRMLLRPLFPSSSPPPSLLLQLPPPQLMSSTTPRPAVHAYQYVSHPRRMLRPAPHDLALDLWRRRASFCLFFFLLFSSGGGS